MSKIHIMSENLANKIAAGEVVERISSVVKEIVENSIDAKSKNIKVELLDAGKKSIRVIDDGIGMDKNDAKNCFQRHATSKLYKDDDLFFINTLGFRGEALPSIASVSEIFLETYNNEEGSTVHIKGGTIIEEGIAPSRVGTSIEVTNLFYNTPARLKYLKSEPTELASVTQFIEKLALSYPDISFSLTNNASSIIRTSGSGDLLKTIHEIYGLEISSNMIEIRGMNDDYDISGYISKPIIQRKNRNYINTIINGRIIKNYELNKIINDAYYTYKPDSTYPVVVINIETDPTLIDVNIHPTKQDIKFSKMEELKEILTSTIKEALYKTMLIPDVIMNNQNSKYKIEDALPSTLFISEPKSVSDKTEVNTTQVTETTNVIQMESFFEEEIIENQSFNQKNSHVKSLDLYPVGIALGTYIIAENSEGVYLIDQHAAVERINYEKVLNGLLSNEATTMLIPITIELTHSDMQILSNKMDLLNKLGFEIEEFGINTFKINAHPIWIKTGFEYDTIREIFDIIVSENKNFDPIKFNDKVAATIACKKSLKGNTRITLELASEIIEELKQCDNPYNCPHGRPTIIKFTIYELEKMFKRSM